jgi:hypothetical protein
MARLGLLRTSDDTKRQPKPVSPYSRNPNEMLPRIRDRVTRDPVGEEWLRTYAKTLRGYHGTQRPNSWMAITPTRVRLAAAMCSPLGRQ